MAREGNKSAGESSKQSGSNKKTQNSLKPEPKIAKNSPGNAKRNSKADNDHAQNKDKNVKERRYESSKEKVDGVVFMCNTKTKGDCFRYMVMGFPKSKKEIVENIKPGVKLFLYDFDARLLHGIYIATSNGGMDLERDAFDGAYPAQVRFKAHLDCLPISEEAFKKTVMGSSSGDKIKFNPELTTQQVCKLLNLFHPLNNHQPISTPLIQLRPVLPTAEARSNPSHSEIYPISSHMETGPIDILSFGEKEYRKYGLRQRQILTPVPYTNKIESDSTLLHRRIEEREYRRPISDHYYDDNHLYRVSRSEIEDGRLHSAHAANALSEYNRGGGGGGDHGSVPVSSRYSFSGPLF